MRSICSIAGCRSFVMARTVCGKHYRRLMTHGDPEGGQKTYRGDPIRFLEAAVSSDTDDCILWPYALNSKGYGNIEIDGRIVLAHRETLSRKDGVIYPPSICALHAPTICHNPKCINPKHLRWATQAENAADRMIDGTEPIGEQKWSAKLTVEQVLNIRKDPRPHAITARDYAVGPSAVKDIRTRKTWRWLADQS